MHAHGAGRHTARIIKARALFFARGLSLPSLAVVPRGAEATSLYVASRPVY